jgi:hypothetical protein
MSIFAVAVCVASIIRITAHVWVIAVRHSLALSHNVLSHHKVLILAILVHIALRHAYVIKSLLFPP